MSQLRHVGLLQTAGARSLDLSDTGCREASRTLRQQRWSWIPLHCYTLTVPRGQQGIAHFAEAAGSSDDWASSLEWPKGASKDLIGHGHQKNRQSKLQAAQERGSKVPPAGQGTRRARELIPAPEQPEKSLHEQDAGMLETP